MADVEKGELRRYFMKCSGSSAANFSVKTLRTSLSCTWSEPCKIGDGKEITSVYFAVRQEEDEG